MAVPWEEKGKKTRKEKKTKKSHERKGSFV
jgi:hypothetical protein